MPTPIARKATEKELQTIKNGLANELSVRKIARQLQVSDTKVHNWIRENCLQPPNRKYTRKQKTKPRPIPVQTQYFEHHPYYIGI